MKYRVYYLSKERNAIHVKDLSSLDPANKFVQGLNKQDGGWIAYELPNNGDAVSVWRYTNDKQGSEITQAIANERPIIYRKKVCFCGNVICSDEMTCESRACKAVLAV